jgi:quinol monooxygenase YgiN
MQFVIGWLQLIPGKREEFLSLALPHQHITQREEGCLFYEWHLSVSDMDGLVLVEGWTTREHHQAHQSAPHHKALLQQVGEFAVSGRFEEIDAANVVTRRLDFSS